MTKPIRVYSSGVGQYGPEKVPRSCQRPPPYPPEFTCNASGLADLTDRRSAPPSAQDSLSRRIASADGPLTSTAARPGNTRRIRSRQSYRGLAVPARQAGPSRIRFRSPLARHAAVLAPELPDSRLASQRAPEYRQDTAAALASSAAPREVSLDFARSFAVVVLCQMILPDLTR